MGMHGRTFKLAVIALATISLLGLSCSNKDDAKITASTPTTAKGSTDSADSSSSTASTTAKDSDNNPWHADAQSFRGQDGTEHEINCPADGSADTVWGAGVYTDDSSVCTAAVQSGLITFEKGGDVTILIGPGKNSFDGGIANGVESQSYGNWEGSFTFPDAPPGSVEFTTSAATWKETLSSKASELGAKVTVTCSSNGRAGSVWGSGPFTTDSSVCTAAVFAGLITFKDGGQVVAEIGPGQSSFNGSTKNGVTTSEYGSYDSSFTFPADLNSD